jgi:phosphomannomutase
MAGQAALYPPLDKRPIANTICLFDVDNTLTVPRRVSSPSLRLLLLATCKTLIHPLVRKT